VPSPLKIKGEIFYHLLPITPCWNHTRTHSLFDTFTLSCACFCCTATLIVVFVSLLHRPPKFRRLFLVIEFVICILDTSEIYTTPFTFVWGIYPLVLSLDHFFSVVKPIMKCETVIIFHEIQKLEIKYRDRQIYV